MRLQTRLILVMGGIALAVMLFVVSFSLYFLKGTLHEIDSIHREYVQSLTRMKVEDGLAIEEELLYRLTMISFRLFRNFPALPANPDEQSYEFFTGALDHSKESIRCFVGVVSNRNDELIPQVLFGKGFERTSDGLRTLPGISLDQPSALKDYLMAPHREPSSTYVIHDHHLWILHIVPGLDDGNTTYYAFEMSPEFLVHALNPAHEMIYMIASGQQLLCFADSKSKVTQDEVRTMIQNSLPPDFTSAEFSIRDYPVSKLVTFQKQVASSSYLLTGIRLRGPLFSAQKKGLSLYRLTPNKATNNVLIERIDRMVEILFVHIFVMLSIGILLFFLPLFLFSHRISKPLTQVVTFANTLANGEFPPPVSYQGKIEEIATLFKALNHMRDRLNNLFLKQKHSHQRELMARKDAENANLLKSDVLLSMSPNMKKQVSSILGFSDVLLHELRSGHDLKATETAAPIQTIHLNAEKLSETIEIMLELGLLDSAGDEPKFSEFDTNAFLYELATKAQQLANGKSIALENRYSSEIPPQLYSDKEILFRSLAQILHAVIKSATRNTRVSFGCETNKKNLIFWVKSSDKGHLSNEFTHYSKNIGLIPLSSCVRGHEILLLTISKNNSHVLGAEFESVESAESSLFRVVFSSNDILPRLSATASSPIHMGGLVSPNMASNSAAHNTTPKTKIIDFLVQNQYVTRHIQRVLVLEDSDESFMMLKMMLRDCHCKLDQASSMQKCAELLAASHYQLLMINVHMNQTEAEKLIADLRADNRYAALSIIALFSYLEEGEKERFHSLGVNICLLKPLNTEDLVHAVSSIEEGNDR